MRRVGWPRWVERGRGDSEPEAAAHDRVGVGVVVLPVGPDVLLAADVPHVELEATVLHRLDVEALRRGGGRDVLVAQLAKDGGLPRVVQAEDQDARLFWERKGTSGDGRVSRFGTETGGCPKERVVPLRGVGDAGGAWSVVSARVPRRPTF